MLLLIMNFIRIQLYLFLRPRSSFDFHKVPIISIWEVQQSLRIKASRCLYTSHMSYEIYWKPPTSAINCFQKSFKDMPKIMICSWTEKPECFWVGCMSFLKIKNFLKNQEFSLPTFVWMSAVMPLHHIYNTVLQGWVGKGYSEITNKVPSGSTAPGIRVWTSKEEVENKRVRANRV